MDNTQDILIVNSDGLWAEDRRVRSRFSIEAVAGNGNEKQSGRFSPGGSEGLNCLIG